MENYYTKPALIIMAAGMGSRFGGLKQVTPLGPSGELIIDYSIHDAMEAGFERIVFVIKHEIEDVFKEFIGNRIEKTCRFFQSTGYVFRFLQRFSSSLLQLVLQLLRSNLRSSFQDLRPLRRTQTC